MNYKRYKLPFGPQNALKTYGFPVSPPQAPKNLTISDFSGEKFRFLPPHISGPWGGNFFCPPIFRNPGGEVKKPLPPHMAENRHPPKKMLQSRNENRSWIFPNFHHRDPKIRENHKIKTHGSTEISSKWMKKFPKNQKSWNFGLFIYFRGLSLSWFQWIQVFEKLQPRVAYRAKIDKIHEFL